MKVVSARTCDGSAGVAELADARDLKSRDTRVSYRFDPGYRHQTTKDGQRPSFVV